jgi:hypothetical protein
VHLAVMLLNISEARPASGDRIEVPLPGTGNGTASRFADVLPSDAEGSGSLEPISASLQVHNPPPRRHAERHPWHEEMASVRTPRVFKNSGV